MTCEPTEMNNKVYLVTLLTSILLTACTSQTADHLELNSFDKKLSYMFAFGSASQVKALGIQFDLDVVRQAITDVNNGAAPRLTQEEVEQTNQAFQLLQIEADQP